jgi:hypothetical protein
MTDAEINHAIHEKVEGCCVHRNCETIIEVKWNLDDYSDVSSYCVDCEDWARTHFRLHEGNIFNHYDSFFISEIPDYLNDPAYVLETIKKYKISIHYDEKQKWIAMFSWISKTKTKYYIGIEDSKCLNWVSVQDESLNRAILLALLKKKGVER